MAQSPTITNSQVTLLQTQTSIWCMWCYLVIQISINTMSNSDLYLLGLCCKQTWFLKKGLAHLWRYGDIFIRSHTIKTIRRGICYKTFIIHHHQCMTLNPKHLARPASLHQGIIVILDATLCHVVWLLSHIKRPWTYSTSSQLLCNSLCTMLPYLSLDDCLLGVWEVFAFLLDLTPLM